MTVVFLLAADGGSAGAQSRVATYSIRGETHRFSVPAGWATQPGQDLVTFAAPAGRVKAAFQCVVMGASMPAGVSSTADLVKLLADDEIKNRKPWARVVDKKQTTFVGATGDLIALAGVGPDKKDRVTVLVAARAKSRLYVFVAEGRKDDFHAVVKDLEEILQGVEPLGAAPEAIGTGTKGSFGQGTPATPGEREAGPVTGVQAALADPLWGVTIAGLDGKWRLRTDGSGYVLVRADPPATVRIERMAGDAAKLRKSLKGARPGTFAGKDALLLDGAVYVLRADHAIAIRGDAAQDQIERAIRFTDPSYRPGAGKKGGAGLTLPFGVEVWPLPPPWRLDLADSGPAAAGLYDPDAGVRLELRVRRPDSPSDNPFYGDEQTFATTCTTRKGVYDELPVAVVGATRAVRYRCRGARHENGAAMAAMMYRAVGSRGAHLLVFAYYEAATAETPDRAVADVLQYVRFVEKQ